MELEVFLWLSLEHYMLAIFVNVTVRGLWNLNCMTQKITIFEAWTQIKQWRTKYFLFRLGWLKTKIQDPRKNQIEYTKLKDQKEKYESYDNSYLPCYMLSLPLIEVRSQNTVRVFNSLLHGDCSIGYSIWPARYYIRI